jgi:hypothetical protein
LDAAWEGAVFQEQGEGAGAEFPTGQRQDFRFLIDQVYYAFEGMENVSLTGLRQPGLCSGRNECSAQSSGGVSGHGESIS